MIVSIPQAVSAIAIRVPELAPSPKAWEVSIPQAVSAIAILWCNNRRYYGECFNTASGKCYCNSNKKQYLVRSIVGVSIPQAVSAIAIMVFESCREKFEASFNTASGKCYCN